ncbi:HNH endonuclease [Falsarthrobacter nasiphocae]|uniref:HNH endonuclease signature motif containing protein n=2 Tax=Falsarthrobacter nasiphocae TaxID=189863 RepID=UPI00360DADC7
MSGFAALVPQDREAAVDDSVAATVVVVDPAQRSRRASESPKRAVLPQAQRAAATFDRFSAYASAGVRTVGQNLAYAGERLAGRLDGGGALALADGHLADGARVNSFQENLQMAMASQRTGAGSGLGSGPGGAGVGGRVSDDPARGIVGLNRKDGWNDIQHREFDKKVTGLDEEAKAANARGESMKFQKPGDRYWSKERILNQYPEKAYDLLPDHLKSKELSDAWEALNKRSDLSEASLRRERRELVRETLKGYDLDHKVDLQLGGKDSLDNIQWLDMSVNRSVGSQLRWKVGNPESGKFARLSDNGEKPGTPIREFLAQPK